MIVEVIFCEFLKNTFWSFSKGHQMQPTSFLSVAKDCASESSTPSGPDWLSELESLY